MTVTGSKYAVVRNDAATSRLASHSRVFAYGSMRNGLFARTEKSSRIIPRMDRLTFLACSLAGIGSFPDPGFAAEGLTAFSRLESSGGGRLGVAALDTGSRKTVGYRENERFAMLSTFKFALCANVLQRVDSGAEALTRRVAYGASDLLHYAPVTRAHVAQGGMTVEALCAAAMEHSDNTAANLLLASVGGPTRLTHFVRALGDSTTRFDRTEPTLNTAIPGDERDTTTPRAMLALMHRILLGGHVLSEASRARLNGWLAANTTGETRLRAGLPKDWRVGDKTGTGDNGASNDIAIVRPPGREPLLVVAFSAYAPGPQERRDATIAEVAKIVAQTLEQRKGR